MSDTRSAQSPMPPGAMTALLARRRAAGHEIQNIPSIYERNDRTYDVPHPPAMTGVSFLGDQTYVMGVDVTATMPTYHVPIHGPMMIDPMVDANTMAQMSPAGLLRVYRAWAMAGADRVLTWLYGPKKWPMSTRNQLTEGN